MSEKGLFIVIQFFEESPDIAVRLRDVELGWFQILDGLLKCLLFGHLSHKLPLLRLKMVKSGHHFLPL